MTGIEFKNYLTTLLDSLNFPTHPHLMFSEIKRDKLVSSFIEKNCDKHQNFDNDLLLDTLAEIYLTKNKFLNVKFKYKVQENLLLESTPRLCLNLHSNFSPLTKLILFKNQKINILSSFPNTVRKVFFYSGINNGNVNIFKRDSTSLLRAKYLLDKSQCVSATIDFRTSIPGIFNLLSDGLLRMAYQTKPQTFFGVNYVTDAGEVNYETIKLDLTSNLSDNKDYILGFINSRRKKSNYTWEKFNYLQQNQMLSKVISNLQR